MGGFLQKKRLLSGERLSPATKIPKDAESISYSERSSNAEDFEAD